MSNDDLDIVYTNKGILKSMVEICHREDTLFSTPKSNELNEGEWRGEFGKRVTKNNHKNLVTNEGKNWNYIKKKKYRSGNQ